MIAAGKYGFTFCDQKTMGLTVTDLQERDGLDYSEHGETAYNS